MNGDTPRPLKHRTADFEKRICAFTVRKHHGCKEAACVELGISLATLYRKLGPERPERKQQEAGA